MKGIKSNKVDRKARSIEPPIGKKAKINDIKTFKHHVPERYKSARKPFIKKELCRFIHEYNINDEELKIIEDVEKYSSEYACDNEPCDYCIEISDPDPDFRRITHDQSITMRDYDFNVHIEMLDI